jgi:uncharacterized membrane protein YphA (DoxX/SURF4 family)
VGYVALFIMGPGRFSIDALIRGKSLTNAKAEK